MVELAIRSNPSFCLDDREVRRSSESFTIDTVESIRAELGESVPICLIVGADAFALFETWYRWQDLLQLVHVVVAGRPGCSLEPPTDKLRAICRACLTEAPLDLEKEQAGLIFPLSVALLDVSATRIRHDLLRGIAPRYLVPDSVLEYIEMNNLYGNMDA